MTDEIGNEKRDYLHQILDRCTYDDDRKRTLHYVIDELLYEHQYQYVLNRMLMNEIKDEHRISMGFNYSQSDIKKTLKKK